MPWIAWAPEIQGSERDPVAQGSFLGGSMLRKLGEDDPRGSSLGVFNRRICRLGDRGHGEYIEIRGMLKVR